MATKLFTYLVGCSFRMQYTFTESEVEQSDGGNEGEMAPTDAAMKALKTEIERCLVEHFGGVQDVEVSADGDDLLGVTEE